MASVVLIPNPLNQIGKIVGMLFSLAFIIAGVELFFEKAKTDNSIGDQIFIIVFVVLSLLCLVYLLYRSYVELIILKLDNHNFSIVQLLIFSKYRYSLENLKGYSLISSSLLARINVNGLVIYFKNRKPILITEYSHFRFTKLKNILLQSEIKCLGKETHSMRTKYFYEEN